MNLLKTKEIVFCRPSARSFLPSCLTGIERVVSAKLLGVTFCSNLKFDKHVKNILTICSQRCYLLKCLKAQGLPAKQLDFACRSVVALPYFISFFYSFFIDIVTMMLCYVLFLQWRLIVV